MKKVAVIGGDDIDSLCWHINYTLNKLEGYSSEIFELGGRLPVRLVHNRIRYFLNNISPAFSSMIHNQLVGEIISYEPNLVIVVVRNIDPSAIAQLRSKLEVKIIFWTGDAITMLERGYALISEYDAWFVKDKYMHHFMQDKIGLNVFYLPECCNPDIHSPPDNVTFGSEYDVTVAGTLYPYRAKIIDQLMDENIEVTVFGNIPRWMDAKWHTMHTGRYIVAEEKSRVFYGSKINLNTLHYSEINAGNCRLFEVAGCGGFQICDRKEAITEYFEEDKEVVCYERASELTEKIRHYLQHRDEAFEIAANALKRAHGEHTYQHRLQEIFRIIGFDQE